MTEFTDTCCSAGDKLPGLWLTERRGVRAAPLAWFYLVLSVIRSAGWDLGGAKFAASVDAFLAWISWQAVRRTNEADLMGDDGDA